MNCASLQRSAEARSFMPGRLFFPLELTCSRGLSDESKNCFRRELISMTCFGGTFMISMMHASCSTSFSPGNSGNPVYSSARMHPSDQQSIGRP
ncbi:hypothetical protein DIPPA_19855 [Diplonema papillatum]|nr:hypothetical protein DIPPA_19855 [Diplonema papillatum]